MKDFTQAHFVGDVNAAADFLGPGAIETNRYQAEIFDMVRRRFVFGQKVELTPATGQPSRYFDQVAIPTASFTNTRALTSTATQPQRVERPLTLKAISAGINYGIFDIEVTQQQGQFAYLEAKDLTDTVDAVLKLHDQALWTGTDTDLVYPTTTQYFGVSGQIVSAATLNSGPASLYSIPATGSLVDGYKTAIAEMIARTDFEVSPTGIYMNPLLGNLFDQEAKSVQLYFNQVEVLPGVIVSALPTAAGTLPLIKDAAIPNYASPGGKQYSGFIITEKAIEYHYLTAPQPRVFQLGLAQNLAGQFMVVKFGAVVVKGVQYAHRIVVTVR